jgi:hypothetical protein
VAEEEEVEVEVASAVEDLDARDEIQAKITSLISYAYK